MGVELVNLVGPSHDQFLWQGLIPLHCISHSGDIFTHFPILRLGATLQPNHFPRAYQDILERDGFNSGQMRRTMEPKASHLFAFPLPLPVCVLTFLPLHCTTTRPFLPACTHHTIFTPFPLPCLCAFALGSVKLFLFRVLHTHNPSSLSCIFYYYHTEKAHSTMGQHDFGMFMATLIPHSAEPTKSLGYIVIKADLLPGLNTPSPSPSVSLPL